MTRQEFLMLFDEALELPAGTLKGPEKLDELDGWDSLSMITFMGLADEHCHTKLSPRQFVNCKTVDDLLGLANLPVA